MDRVVKVVIINLIIWDPDIDRCCLLMYNRLDKKTSVTEEELVIDGKAGFLSGKHDPHGAEDWHAFPGGPVEGGVEGGKEGVAKLDCVPND